jgi:hypothetical protein
MRLVDNGRAFRRDDARNASEIARDADVRPGRRFKQRLNRRERVVAEFENEQAAGFEARGGLRDEVCVKLIAFFAAVKSELGFVIADFPSERGPFPAADVGRIANNKIKER